MSIEVFGLMALLVGIVLASLWMMVSSGSNTNSATASAQTATEQVVFITDAALANGLRILGGAGVGKTILAAYVTFYLFTIKSQCTYVLDPTGSYFASFITQLRRYCELNRLTPSQQRGLYNRIKLYELGGESGYVGPTPLLARFPGESLASVSDRVMAWIESCMPESRSASVMGYNALAKIVRPGAMLLVACGLQITELPDLLYHPKSGRWRRHYQEALNSWGDEVGEAVRFFRDEYSNWDKGALRQQLPLVETWLQPFRYTPAWRASFGASNSGFDDAGNIREGRVIFILADGLEGEYRQQLLDWHLRRLVSFLNWRGSGRGPEQPPFGLSIDEMASLFTSSDKGMQIFSQLLGEIVHRYRRQYGLHPLCILHQSEAQLHPDIASHLAALGQIIGKPADYDSALKLAPQLFDYRPTVKYWEPVLMNIPERGIEVVHRRPVEFTRDELLHQQAEILMSMDRFKFLCRLSPYTEGGRRTELQQLDFAPLVSGFPDAAWVREKRRDLVAQSGVPIQQILSEIAARSQHQNNQQTEDDIVTDTYDRAGFVRSRDTSNESQTN